jgi:hypothetical protein
MINIISDLNKSFEIAEKEIICNLPQREFTSKDRHSKCFGCVDFGNDTYTARCSECSRSGRRKDRYEKRIS